MSLLPTYFLLEVIGPAHRLGSVQSTVLASKAKRQSKPPVGGLLLFRLYVAACYVIASLPLSEEQNKRKQNKKEEEEEAVKEAFILTMTRTTVTESDSDDGDDDN